LSKLTRGEQLKYLGSISHQSRDYSDKIKPRLTAARTALRALWKFRTFNVAITLRLLKSLVWSVGPYGC